MMDWIINLITGGRLDRALADYARMIGRHSRLRAKARSVIAAAEADDRDGLEAAISALKLALEAEK